MTTNSDSNVYLFNIGRSKTCSGYMPLSPVVFLLTIIGLDLVQRANPDLFSAAAEPSGSTTVASTTRGNLDWDRCGSVTRVSRRSRSRHGPHGATPRDCAECHRQIVNSWARSAHARAWDNPEFLVETDNYAASDCLTCHAPSPLLQQADLSEPELRKGQHSLGVDCHACHYLDRAYAGPYAARAPHRIKVVGQRLSRSKFCGSCHVMEYDEFDSLYVSSLARPSAARGCVDCHMPAYVSRLTQDHLLSLIHPKRRVRSHRLETWTESLLRNAVVIGDLRVQDQGNGCFEVDFTLTNRGAGHRIPTGEHGHRELSIRVEWNGRDGQRVAEEGESLLASYEEGLDPGVATPFSFSLANSNPSPPATVRVLVERVNQDRSFCRTLAIAELRISD